MLPDRVSNPGPLTYESGALPIALRGPAFMTKGSAQGVLKRKITDPKIAVALSIQRNLQVHVNLGGVCIDVERHCSHKAIFVKSLLYVISSAVTHVSFIFCLQLQTLFLVS